MKENKIHETTKYSLFKLLKGNRPIKKVNLANIIASMKMNNFLHLNPILVTSNMEVLDGQHRLKACEELGVKVY